MRPESVLEENQTRPRRNLREGGEGKNLVDWRCNPKDGRPCRSVGVGVKPYFGSTIVALNLEYIDSVHSQGGAMTSCM